MVALWRLGQMICFEGLIALWMDRGAVVVRKGGIVYLFAEWEDLAFSRVESV